LSRARLISEYECDVNHLKTSWKQRSALAGQSEPLGTHPSSKRAVLKVNRAKRAPSLPVIRQLSQTQGGNSCHGGGVWGAKERILPPTREVVYRLGSGGKGFWPPEWTSPVTFL